MAILVKRTGFGQVEPNHLSAQHNGQIYAQLPCATGVFADEMLENGQFVKYDYANGVVNLSGSGEWLLVMNEIKLYDERKQGYKNFAYRASDFTDKKMYPRLLRVELGDLFTTNTFGHNNSETAQTAGTTLSVGDPLMISTATGYLTPGTAAAGEPQFEVVQEYYLADTQPAVKVRRVK